MNIYIAYTDLYPDQIKIGMTKKSVEKRMRELSSYGTEEQYQIDGYKALYVFENSPVKDFYFHRKFKQYRIGSNRELFDKNCLEEVIKYMRELKKEIRYKRHKEVMLRTHEMVREDFHLFKNKTYKEVFSSYLKICWS